MLAVDYDEQGAPVHVCDTCTRGKSMRVLLGCGLEPEYRGRGRATMDTLGGVCPGWYRASVFAMDALRYIRLRDNIQITPDTPRRLIDVLYYYDVYSASREAKKRNEVQ